MVEFIGFFISLLALLYIFIRQAVTAQRSLRSQELEQEEDPLREFMKAAQTEATAREVAQRRSSKKPPVLVINKQSKQSKKPSQHSLGDHQLTSAIEERRVKSTLEDHHLQSRFNHLEEGKTHVSSRASKAMQRLSSRRDLLIYYEIMHPPKSMR